MPSQPRKWTQAELTRDAARSREAFRRERVDEPLTLYTQFFSAFAKIFEPLIDQLPALTADPVDPQLVAELVTGRDQQKSFRYLAAPPISKDDLETVADASLTPSRLKVDAASAGRVRDAVLSIIDPYRFPWIPAKRLPTMEERNRAVIASAALAAAREVEMWRRNTAKDVQEKAVKDLLTALGLKEIPKRPIPMLTAAPAPGEFCGETTLAGTRADVVARLTDGRVMAIECKVSNSSVNSYKRVVHDTGGKATTWYNQLGRAQILPCAVLSGVFSSTNLRTVQDEKSVFLFWQHRLSDLSKFIKSV